MLSSANGQATGFSGREMRVRISPAVPIIGFRVVRKLVYSAFTASAARSLPTNVAPERNRVEAPSLCSSNGRAAPL